MEQERILSLLGYDPELLQELSNEERHAIRGSAIVWLIACLTLGVAAGYSATLIQPSMLASLIGGLGVGILTLNLLRVVNAGGGSPMYRTLQRSEAAAARHRPSLIPAVVFGVLAAILSQPGQLPLWPELDQEVELHRQTLITQHDAAATDLGTDASYYREELEAAGFPIFRIKLIWRDPRRALRMTALLCLLVLLPGFWSQVISIKGQRAYELARCRRSHEALVALRREGRAEARALLAQWPTYQPPTPWLRRTGPAKSGPWLRRGES
jgi:hypothetical protein